MKSPLDFDSRVGDIANPHSDRREQLRRAQKRAEMDGMSGDEAREKFADPTNDSLRDLEESGNKIVGNHRVATTPKLARRTQKRGSWLSNSLQTLTRAKLRGKTSMITVLFLLFGGGGFLTVLFSPSIAIIEMKEVLAGSLNDQLHALDSRSSAIMRAKMKSVTTGSCGLVKIKCNFATMSDAEVKAFEKNNSGIKIEREMTDANRGKITKITYTDTDGVTVIDDASKLQHELNNNVAFRTAWTKGYNPKYMGLADKVALSIFARNKASKAESVSGNNDEEREKKLNEIAGGVQDSGAESLTRTTDENGKETYVDETGQPVDPTEINNATNMSNDIDALEKKGGTAGLIKSGLVSGLSIDAAGENACTTFNFARRVSALAKIAKKSQAIRFALALVLTNADKIKAGDATEGDISFAGNNLMTPQPSNKVIDDSKLTAKSSTPAMVTDPEAGGNAFDSPGYRIAAYGDAPKLSTRASRFSLSAGSATIIDTVVRNVARVVNGGNPDPKAVSQKCKYIQNNFVRVGAFGAGLATGALTLGASTAIGLTLSTAWSLAMPYLESYFGDMVAGNIFKDISGIDSGDATYVGTAALMGDIAQNRGMTPVTDQGGEDYVYQNQQTVQKYNEVDQYAARQTPFDITNRFSFLGSMAFALEPAVQQSRTSAGLAMMSFASLIPQTFANIVQPVKAASKDYFSRCDDPIYQSDGIKAGPFCEVRYWMSDKQLAMDPLDNVQWMVDSGNIDADSGSAKDNSEDWNYEKFLTQCANRTVGWGEDEGEDEGDGTNCFNPQYQELNDHFGVYTMDKSIQDSMDASDQPQQPAPGTTGVASGKSGPVGGNGWAFPTAATDNVTHGFQPPHMGLDIAAKDDATTKGQSIYAAYAGKVIKAGPSQDYGNWIVIEHQVNGQTMTTVYGHMDDDGILVQVGDQVKTGQEIGRIGSAGTDGKPYLYFELWQGQIDNGGTRIDPALTVETARASAGAIND